MKILDSWHQNSTNFWINVFAYLLQKVCIAIYINDAILGINSSHLPGCAKVWFLWLCGYVVDLLEGKQGAVLKILFIESYRVSLGGYVQTIHLHFFQHSWKWKFWPIWRLNSFSRAPCSPWTMILGTKSRSSWSWYPSINVIQIVHMKVSYSFLFPTPVDMRGLCAGSFAYIPSNYNIIHLYIQHAYKIYIYIQSTHTKTNN